MGGGRALALAALLAATAPGCGSQERQDANEPPGSHRVEVLEARFPERQRLARQTELSIEVRNRSSRTLPDLAVTLDGLSRRDTAEDLSDAGRPVWIVDRAPSGGTTAYDDTWSVDGVRPGQTRTFTWRVTPVVAGRHEVTWRVAAGLDGRAETVVSGGGAPQGTFPVTVAGRPPGERVDPETGEVVPVETPAR